MAILSNFPGGSVAKLTTGSMTPTETGYTLTPPDGYDGFSAVEIEAIPESYKTAYNIYVHTETAYCTAHGVVGDTICGISDPLTISTLKAVEATSGATVALGKDESGFFAFNMPADDVIISR